MSEKFSNNSEKIVPIRRGKIRKLEKTKGLFEQMKEEAERIRDFQEASSLSADIEKINQELEAEKEKLEKEKEDLS